MRLGAVPLAAPAGGGGLDDEAGGLQGPLVEILAQRDGPLVDARDNEEEHGADADPDGRDNDCGVAELSGVAWSELSGNFVFHVLVFRQVGWSDGWWRWRRAIASKERASRSRSRRSRRLVPFLPISVKL